MVNLKGTFIFSVLITMVLIGCSSEQPTIDTSSAQALKESVAEIKSSLDDSTKAERFDNAVSELAMSKTDGLAGALPMGLMLKSGVDPEDGSLEKLSFLDGMTANDVISEAVRMQLSDLNEQAKKIQEQLNRLEAMEDSIEIDNVRVTPPGEYSFAGDASVEVEVTNNSTTPISSIRVIGVYADPDRSIPYSDHEYLFLFDGGIEPGETKSESSTPSSMGTLSVEENASMTLHITEVEGPNDKDIVSVEEPPSELTKELERIDSERDSLGSINIE